MRVVVLISCMNQVDSSIIQRTNIQTDVVVVNQCNKNETIDFDFEYRNGETCHAKFISTTERGLSRSRNMAIQNAEGDICLICDDDEVLEEGYEQNIIKGYEHFVNADIITFKIKKFKKTYPIRPKRLWLKDIFKTSSIQITFRKEFVNSKKIKFDEKMGSGSGNGGGEENKFMMDCYRHRAKMYYYPQYIATLLSSESLWFQGYTNQYFRDKGWAFRRSLGLLLGGAYTMAFPLMHKILFSKNNSIINIYRQLIIGFFKHR